MSTTTCFDASYVMRRLSLRFASRQHNLLRSIGRNLLPNAPWPVRSRARETTTGSKRAMLCLGPLTSMSSRCGFHCCVPPLLRGTRPVDVQSTPARLPRARLSKKRALSLEILSTRSRFQFSCCARVASRRALVRNNSQGQALPRNDLAGPFGTALQEVSTTGGVLLLHICSVQLVAEGTV